MQRRILTAGPLHDDRGQLVETGYATELIKTYDRRKVAAKRRRIKEWDYYMLVHSAVITRGASINHRL